MGWSQQPRHNINLFVKAKRSLYLPLHGPKDNSQTLLTKRSVNILSKVHALSLILSFDFYEQRRAEERRKNVKEENTDRFDPVTSRRLRCLFSASSFSMLINDGNELFVCTESEKKKLFE